MPLPLEQRSPFVLSLFFCLLNFAFARPTRDGLRRRGTEPLLLSSETNSVLEGGIALNLSPAHVSVAVRIVEKLALQPPPASLGYFGGR